MIFVRLLELKIALFQLINKPLIYLVAVNILILLAINQVFYAIWGLYKPYISYGIAYKTTAIIYSLVTDIFIKVYIIV